MPQIKPDGERIAVVETKVDDVTQKLDNVASDVKQIMVLLSDKYITRAEVANEVSDLKAEVASLKSWRWATHTASAVIGSLLFYLISFVLTHR